MIYNYESGFVDFDFTVPEFEMDETDMLNLILVRKNLTVRELAKKLGISHTHLYKKLKSEPKELLLTIMKKRVYRCK
jgi:DNA-binding phage protein